MDNKKDPITKEEFESFRSSVIDRLNGMEIGILSALIKGTSSEHSIRRLSMFLTDIKKLMTSKDLINFGNKDELLSTFQEEIKLWAEMLELIQKFPKDMSKIIKKDNENQLKLVDIIIKRTELLLQRTKGKNLGGDVENALKLQLKGYKENRKKLFKKFDPAKEFKELNDIRDFSTALKGVNVYLDENRKDFAKRFQKLPNLPEDIHLELRLSSLYSEIHRLCWLGLGSSAVVMIGVLLEAILKEIIFFKEKKEFSDIVGEKNADFGRAIQYCDKSNYISEEEETMLEGFRIEIRNKYQHHNVNAIAEGISVGGVKIDIKNCDNPLEVIKKTLDDLKNGKIEYESFDQSELRPIGDLIKVEVLDKNRAIPLFLKVHEFLVKKAKQYFTENQKITKSKKENEK